MKVQLFLCKCQYKVLYQRYKEKAIQNTLILKIKMQLLCILSKSHFWFGIKWKDYALQQLEESICIIGPIDYRLLKTDRNLKELSVYTLSNFWIHFILHRPTLTASANTGAAWKWKWHLSGITGPGLCCLIQAHCTHRSTPAMLGSSLLKCHLYFTAEWSTKNVRFTACQHSTETAHVFVIPQAASLSSSQLPCHKSTCTPS